MKKTVIAFMTLASPAFLISPNIVMAQSVAPLSVTAQTVSPDTSLLVAVPHELIAGETVSFKMSLKDAQAFPIPDREFSLMISYNEETMVRTLKTDATGSAVTDFVPELPGGISASAMVDSAHFITSATIIPAAPTAAPTAASAPVTAIVVPPEFVITEVASPMVDVPPTPETVAEVEQTVPTFIASKPEMSSELVSTPGSFVWNTGFGKLTYVNPDSLQLLTMWDAMWAFNALREQAMQVPDEVLELLPKADNSDMAIDDSLLEQYGGRMLMTTTDQSRIWYVSPKDMRRHWFDGSVRSYDYLKSISEQK